MLFQKMVGVTCVCALVTTYKLFENSQNLLQITQLFLKICTNIVEGWNVKISNMFSNVN